MKKIKIVMVIYIKKNITNILYSIFSINFSKICEKVVLVFLYELFEEEDVFTYSYFFGDILVYYINKITLKFKRR